MPSRASADMWPHQRKWTQAAYQTSTHLRSLCLPCLQVLSVLRPPDALHVISVTASACPQNMKTTVSLNLRSHWPLRHSDVCGGTGRRPNRPPERSHSAGEPSNTAGCPPGRKDPSSRSELPFPHRSITCWLLPKPLV